MSSLVEELQHDAIDSNVDVSGLLRKAYVVATKLKLEQFKSWCNHELNGYPTREVPAYRQINASLRANNPYNGWIPVVCEDPAFAVQMCVHRNTESVGTLQHMIADAPGESRVVVKFGPEIQRLFDTDFEVALHYGHHCVVGILDAVRNTILEWSLKLEADGIIGEGMSFSSGEKTIAEQKSDDLQSVINNITIENMVNSSIQQSSPKARQSAK